MAFDDQPKIDRYSVNEENSILHIRSFLKQETGFVCRLEVPDKGCDLKAELIEDGTKASHLDFSIQVKSTEKISLFGDGKYISYAFETSRLGYLCRGVPALGYIMLYSVSDDKCYFDYAANIYWRIMEERGNKDWMQNDQVNIHIPVENVLNKASAKKIHEFIGGIFKNATLLQNSYGPKYNIPTVPLDDSHEFDLNNPDKIINLLIRYGTLLINNYDITRLLALIVKVPMADIFKSKNLLFICVVVYTEIGKYLDAKYYFEKYKKMVDESNESELRVVEFASCKIRFALGEITPADFSNSIANIIGEFPGNDHNNIVLKINSVYFQLVTRKGYERFPARIQESINEIYSLIDKADIEERVKWILRIYNTENYIYFSGDIRRDNLSEIKLRESLGDTVTVEEKLMKIKPEMDAQKFIKNIFIAAKKFGDKNEDEIISAHALNGYLKNAINGLIDYYSFGEGKSLSDSESIAQLTNLVKYGMAAADSFFKNGFLKEAYNSLRNAWEILTLAKEGYGYQLGNEIDEKKIMNNITMLEQETDMQPYQPVFEGLINKNRIQKETHSSDNMSFLKEFSDDQVLTFARHALKAFNLPQERLSNIVNEMKGYRMFYQRNSNPDIIVLQLRKDGGVRKYFYANPTEFVLKNKISGIETVPNSDMDKLLQSWNL